MTSLGLRYGTIELVSHDPGWAENFRKERTRLRKALPGAFRIEHVGSTAVPGLDAKPILDIAAAGLEFDISVIVPLLEALGYVYRGDAGQDGGHVFVRGPEPLVRTHHVHVVALDGPQWTAYMLLRDLLIQSAEAREAYQAEKRVLAKRHPNDHKAYMAGKDAIVSRLVAQARARER